MKCPRCQQENPADAQIRPECGASLAPYALSAGQSASRPGTPLGTSSAGRPEGTAL
jgi:hypothetical protein